MKFFYKKSFVFFASKLSWLFAKKPRLNLVSISVILSFPFFSGAVAAAVGIFLAAQVFERAAGADFLGILSLLFAAVFFIRAFWFSLPASATFFRQTTFLSRVNRVYFGGGWLFFFIAAGFWRAQNFRESLNRGQEFFIANADLSAPARLEIISPPEAALKPEFAGRWRAVALIREFNGQKIDFACRARVYGVGEYPQISGVRIFAAKLKIFPQKFPAFPQAFDAPAYFFQEKISGSARIRGNYELLPANAGSWTRIKNQLFAWRQRNAQRLVQFLPDARGSFLAAITFGYLDGLTAEAAEEFRLSGAGHLLAISGMHIGIVAALAWFAGAAAGMAKSRRAIGVAVLMLLFLALSGGRSSALRAGLIALTCCGGVMFARAANFLDSLGVSAILILAANPEQLFAAGFQFSYLAVIFIYGGDRVWKNFAFRSSRQFADTAANGSFSFKPPPRMVKAKNYFIAAIVMCVAATFATAPLMAYYFNLAAPIGLLVNLLAIPLLTWALIGAGLILFLPTAWLLALPLLNDLAAFPAWLLFKIVGFGAAIPHGWFSAFSPPAILLTVYYLFFAIFFIGRETWFRRRYLCAVGLLLAVLPVGVATLKKIPAAPAGLYLLPSEKNYRLFAWSADQKLRVVLPADESNWNEVARFIFSLGAREIADLWLPPRLSIDPQFLRRCAVRKISPLTETARVNFSANENFSFRKNRRGGFWLRWRVNSDELWLARKLISRDWQELKNDSSANSPVIFSDKLPPPQVINGARRILCQTNANFTAQIAGENLLRDTGAGVIFLRDQKTYRWNKNSYREIFPSAADKR